MTTLTLATLLVRLRADNSDYKKGIDDSKKANDDFSKNVKAKIGAAAAAGFALAAAAAVKFAADSVNAASDAQESYSKFQVVFGKVAGETERQLDAMGDAIGRSTHELIGYAGNLGDTLQPLGFNQKAAAELSTTLVGLAADLSSFNNMTMDEALQRLQGTLIGSHENALAFGVVINENTLKAEMAKQGWDKLTGAQLEQAKVQARINLLMAGTTAAQGDATRTADGYANTSRALESALLDLHTAVGENLVPSMTEAKRATIDVVQAATDYVEMRNVLNEAEAKGVISHKQLQEELLRVYFTSKTVADVTDELTAEMEALAEAEALVAQEAESADRAMLNHVEQLEEVWKSAEEVNQAYFDGLEPSHNYADAAYDISDASVREGIAVNEAARKVREKAAENEAAALAEEELARATEEAAEAVRQQRDAYEALTSSAFSQSLNDQVEAALNGKTATVDWKDELFEQASALGLNGQQLALLAAATGDYTDAQIAAALKAAAMSAKVQELATAIANGEITVGNAITALENFETELDNSTTAAEGTGGAALSASEQVDILAQKLTDMDGVTVHATVDLSAIGLEQIQAAEDALARLNAAGAATYGNNPGNQSAYTPPAQAYADGGYTGHGSGIAGLVHQGEYVFSAPAVQAIGLDTLESMHEYGRAGGSSGMGGAQFTFNISGDVTDRAGLMRQIKEAVNQAMQQSGRQANTMRRMR